ncbi:MAG: tRNA 2-thiouridine(34) synthase MnmA [Bacillota bacterium]|nr:tRNA 2-thiouridine(34) synthase MnmA [Bacillota bacterium]
MKGRVVVGMSGGVDSALAAALLLEQGYEVIGVTLNLWPEEEPGVIQERGGCCGLGAVFDARAVAFRLGIPYYVLNLRQEFEEHVVQPFALQYARGRTPNPCVLCNRFIKFDAFLERAFELGADYVATGHYARKEWREGRWHLLKAVDERKDQSYALYAIRQDQLAHALFPLGHLTKDKVREMAAQRRLHTAQKPDSQELCFVATGKYAEEVGRRHPEALQEGVIRHVSGEILGTHGGIAHFTVGQRRGLGLAAGEPLYVVHLDEERGEVWVGPEAYLYREGLIAEDLRLVAMTEEDLAKRLPLPVEVRIRYRGEPRPASIVGVEEGRVEIRFHEPARAVTPGQAAVLYVGDEVLGGATIAAALPHPAQKVTVLSRP